MDQRHENLLRLDEQLFSKRGGLLSFWQEVAENFYVERADFTAQRALGRDFAANLDTSFPILVRRDLGDAFGAMLRPRGSQWFHIRPAQEELETQEARVWLERVERAMRRAMYARRTQFTRATKEADHDFAAFGNAIITVELNSEGTDLLYRCWHLRDVAWTEDADGRLACIHRRWKPWVQQLVALFGTAKLAPAVVKMLEKEPYREIDCRHIVTRTDRYDSPPGGKKWKTPYVSLYIDVDNKHVIEEVGIWNPTYIIPRWMTVSGSQYGHSPATVAALPDARLLQAMTYTLLTAGEKIAEPPMLGVMEAIKGPMELFSGGFTPVDAAYDERMGEVLRPLTIKGDGLPIGLEMTRDTREMISKAFFLDRLKLPPPATGNPMTATEASQRVMEYVRGALPLFEPVEFDYNGALCDISFDVLFRAGAFGSPDTIPEVLQGVDVQFQFESPLREAADKEKGRQLMDAKALIVEAAPLDPMAPQMIDARVALRDALQGIGVPAKWMRNDEQIAQIEASQAEERQAQALLAKVSQGAQVAEQVGMAGQAVNAATQPSQPAAA